MQQQEIDKLTSLRRSIIESIVPLLDSDTLQPLERFNLLSRLAQAQGKVELYEKAFNVAQSLDVNDRLQPFMSLLDDVDYEIDAHAQAPTRPQAQETENTLDDEEEVFSPPPPPQSQEQSQRQEETI